MSVPLYPLKFAPMFRQYLWGGRKLGDLLGKPIGDDDDFAESWELVDHGQDQSRVLNGPLAGTGLNELIERYGPSLLGPEGWASVSDESVPTQLRHRFPLLLKFLDANRVLSVQVHPNDQQARMLQPPDLGKTEAWYVMHAEPESVIYAGLKPNVSRAELADAIARGATQEMLHTIRPRAGDCIFIPAGTVHAIGSGLVIAEIQQASDTTFRLFDWNRVGKDGQPRPLHIAQSLDVIDFNRGPIEPQTPRAIEADGNSPGQLLVECDKFVLRKWSVEQEIRLASEDRFRILVALDQPLEIQAKQQAADSPTENGLTAGDLAELSQSIQPAETLLLPACLGEVTIANPAGATRPANFLEIFLPG